ncbi:hypothetical protein BJ684DRAFT_15054 [Piptocephalis cylindrospora]|uniref:Uncharacterized protein n=1 Tax=Piptocephalis cylindrospora TaxID=1907219 RepID=A0A4P9Y6F6_9FUNG|nr:hypothetical protein BJ684DRAFT_15054 [Piptocephalis cylindrospora]|eukprot:RKP14627.1 hypothetical protein BJ684DRAFT_15054 [Piptocephalis cylindrospora]
MRLHLLTTLPLLLVLLLALSSATMGQQVANDPLAGQPPQQPGAAAPAATQSIVPAATQGAAQASQTVLSSQGASASANGTTPGSGKNQDGETYWTVGIITTLGISILLISIVLQGVSWLSSIGVNVPITPKQKKA